ncbi:MAG: transposase [Rhizomicrobium sp.]
MAQTNEKNNCLRLLRGFCSDIAREKTGGRGRPPIPISDAVYLACYKQYEGLSARRFMCDVGFAHDSDFISSKPHFNSILNKLNDDDVTQALFDLIEFTSIPLRDFERVFAADSSGFGNSMFDRWIVIKPSGKTGRKKKKIQKRKTWTKVHLMCGVDTHIVTAVVIKGQHASDTTQLPELVKMTAKNFELKEVCADRIYGSKKNYEVIGKHGAVPYIAFKSDAVADGPGRTGEFKLGRQLWARMHHEMEFYTEEYLAPCHKRSNVESVFSMIKRKFGHYQRSKAETGRLNEALAKVVCHNICCLNSAIFELGLDLDHLLAPRLRRVGVPQTSRLEAVE